VIAISYSSASDGAAGVQWLHDAAIVGAAFLVLPGGSWRVAPKHGLAQ